ncbi:MAG: DUF3047 domain-containing protein [Nitrospirota bacterium]
MRLFALLWTITVLVTPFPAAAADRQVLFREDFADLDNWKPFFFPRIKKHSVYSIESQGAKPVLRAESSASASALVYKDTFNVYEYPKVTWRWKVKNLYARGNARSKEGDDYPLRVYIMFEFDPDKAGVGERIQYSLVKSFYGEYPPHSSLSYVWASRDDPDKFVVSPYTDKAMMVLLEKGPAKVGAWVDEEIDILEDYQKAFKTKPPARARIAVMNDSDNTGESSVSWMEYIEVAK